MENKQTAVEWLVEKLTNRQNGVFDGFPIMSLDEIYEQAKAMEKEQIIDSFRNGLDDFYDKDTFYYENGEKYYNETYKQQNNEHNRSKN
jgi:hypothetical protein